MKPSCYGINLHLKDACILCLQAEDESDEEFATRKENSAGKVFVRATIRDMSKSETDITKMQYFAIESHKLPYDQADWCYQMVLDAASQIIMQRERDKHAPNHNNSDTLECLK